MIDIQNLPKHIYSGAFRSGSHVQGIATDGEYMYYSFTTFLLKTDMQGNAVGSVDGLLGHLGCIAYDAGVVYGSLEYKGDSIGRDILARLGVAADLPDAFYIACFDTAKINRMHMSAESDDVLRVVCLKDVCDDYKANGHRFGCSGIDGITVCNYTADERSIFVAYGIYGDISRDDNDNQILLRLPISKVKAAARPLLQSTARNIVPIAADEKIFVFTGNTDFGIQNLEYDAFSNKLLAAVYCGKKPQYENYPMFVIDLEAAHESTAGQRRYGIESTKGIRFPYGSTGMIALGGGYYYFSEDGSDGGTFFTNVRLYKADGEAGFARV